MQPCVGIFTWQNGVCVCVCAYLRVFTHEPGLVYEGCEPLIDEHDLGDLQQPAQQ